MRDVSLEMSMERWIDVRGKKGRESIPRQTNVN